jgi:hypothetical protein
MVNARSPVHNIHLVNLGPGRLQFDRVTVSGDAIDFIESDTCGGTRINGYSGCTITVVFIPITNGIRKGNLVIQDNAPGSPQRVPLDGYAIPSVSR